MVSGRMLRDLPCGCIRPRRGKNARGVFEMIKEYDVLIMIPCATPNDVTVCLEGIHLKIQKQAGRASEDCFQRHLQEF